MANAPRNDKEGVEQTYDALTAAGYTIDVVAGDGEESRLLSRSRSVKEVMSCDEGYFVAYDRGDQRAGFVYFVFGNAPDEVVCDYSMSLSHVIDPMTDAWWA